jgi:hypothetical protein
MQSRLPLLETSRVRKRQGGLPHSKTLARLARFMVPMQTDICVEAPHETARTLRSGVCHCFAVGVPGSARFSKALQRRLESKPGLAHKRVRRDR